MGCETIVSTGIWVLRWSARMESMRSASAFRFQFHSWMEGAIARTQSRINSKPPNQVANLLNMRS